MLAPFVPSPWTGEGQGEGDQDETQLIVLECVALLFPLIPTFTRQGGRSSGAITVPILRTESDERQKAKLSDAVGLNSPSDSTGAPYTFAVPEARNAHNSPPRSCPARTVTAAVVAHYS
jgi:hypothetical protein